jgi:hypothetical protein
MASKPKKKRTSTISTGGDIARAPAARWQRGHEAEEDYAEPDALVRTQRLRTGLRQLHRAGTVGDAEVHAADRWYRDYALSGGSREGRGEVVRVDCGTKPRDGLPGAIVDATGRLRAANSAVGRFGQRLLLACVGEGLSLQGAAEVLALNRQALAGAAVVVLDLLASHYAHVDNPRHTPGRNGAGAAHRLAA